MATEGQGVGVRTPDGEYEVLIGQGLLEGLPELLRSAAPAHRYALIADDRVAGLYGERLADALRAAGAPVELLTFPAGESQKSRESWAALSDAMFAAGLGRDSAVLALGGGVTGDLAGFVAATYMRGLPVVQIPTTLLAMIDSSVGGKTGVDTPAGKNLIGAFLQPRLVVADTAVLRTLPDTELRAGLAEAIKHGAIADREYFDWIGGSLGAIMACDPDSMARLVLRSVEIKAEVVGRDEREAGPRKTLNFGHTVGHAVEALSGFRLLHGEAIAIGMMVECAIGEALGVTAAGSGEALGDLLERAGLPTRVPADFAAARVLAGTRSDKKARQGRVEYSLIERIGAASPGADGGWGWPVDDAAVLAALEEHR
jgi:3-dehydroquinate synthase